MGKGYEITTLTDLGSVQYLCKGGASLCSIKSRGKKFELWSTKSLMCIKNLENVSNYYITCHLAQKGWQKGVQGAKGGS